jgi:glycosyltransferase involved in cell wall biosynthesis
MIADVIMPVLNEQSALPFVLKALPWNSIRRVVVVDNGSTDRSADFARQGGAEVVFEPRRGYGRAVWAGILHLMPDPPEVAVFVDGDAADDPAELPFLLQPIEKGEADLVIGSRTKGRIASGAMAPAQRIGNFLIPLLMRALYKTHTTDLGPFRAITWRCLMDLHLADRGFGITAEMQIKAAKMGYRVVEVPVTYRPRIGESKISGKLGSSVKAALKILWIVTKYARFVSN